MSDVWAEFADESLAIARETFAAVAETWPVQPDVDPFTGLPDDCADRHGDSCEGVHE